jgi:hypothetical protein
VVGARDQFAKLLPIRERVSGAKHHDTLGLRHELALWTGRAGDAAGARDQLAALLSAYEQVFGAEHSFTREVLADLDYWAKKAARGSGSRTDD